MPIRGSSTKIIEIAELISVFVIEPAVKKSDCVFGKERSRC